MRKIVKLATLSLPLAAAISCGSKSKSSSTEPEAAAPDASTTTTSSTTASTTASSSTSSTTSSTTEKSSTSTSTTKNAAAAEPYKPENVPGKVAPALPGALLTSNKSGKLLLSNQYRMKLNLMDDDTNTDTATSTDSAASTDASTSTDTTTAGNGDTSDPSMPDPSADLPKAEAPDQNESHGMKELETQLQTLQTHITELTSDFMLLDQVIAAHKDDCGDAEGCVVKDAKATLTAGMARLMVDAAGGEDDLDQTEIDAINKQIDTEIPLGDVTIKHPTNDLHGYTTTVTIVDHESTQVFGWNDDKTVISIHKEAHGEYKDPSAQATLEDANSHPIQFSYSYDFNFDAAKGNLDVSDKSDFDGFKFNNSLSILTAKSGGVNFAVVVDFNAPGASGYKEEMNGFANDDGGYIRTLYKFENTTITLTLTGTGNEGEDYSVFPTNMTLQKLTDHPEDFKDKAVGGFTYAGGAATMAWYEGPKTVPAAGLPTFQATFTYDDATGDFKPTFVASEVEVSAASVHVDETKAGYEEVIGKDGKVANFCFYMGGFDGTPEFCSGGGSGIESDFATSFKEQNGDGGEVKKLGAIEVAVDGIFFDDVEGAELYIIHNTDEKSAADAIAAINDAWISEDADDDEAAMAAVLGELLYTGPEDTTEITDDHATLAIMDFYHPDAHAPVADLGSAKLAKLQYNADTGVPYLVLLADADVVAWEETEETAGKTVSENISSHR